MNVSRSSAWVAVTCWLVILCTGCAPPSLEKEGGYRVTYAVRSDQAGDQLTTIEALQRRLDALGIAGAKVTGGDTVSQVEVSLPGVDSQQVAQLQNALVTPGRLEFRILAQRGTHDALIAAATAAPVDSTDSTQTEDPPAELPVAPAESPEGGVAESTQPASVEPAAGGADRASENEPAADREPEAARTKWVRFDPNQLELPAESVQRTVDGTSEVLIVVDSQHVVGRLLASVSSDVDALSSPAISGQFNAEGSAKLKQLTADNAPRGDVFQYLGIILDDRLLTAPRIMEPIAGAFRLTGKFTQSEVDLLVAVLRTGELPIAVDSQPLKTEQVPGR